MRRAQETVCEIHARSSGIETRQCVKDMRRSKIEKAAMCEISSEV